MEILASTQNTTHVSEGSFFLSAFVILTLLVHSGNASVATKKNKCYCLFHSPHYHLHSCMHCVLYFYGYANNGFKIASLIYTDYDRYSIGYRIGICVNAIWNLSEMYNSLDHQINDTVIKLMTSCKRLKYSHFVVDIN